MSSKGTCMTAVHIEAQNMERKSHTEQNKRLGRRYKLHTACLPAQEDYKKTWNFHYVIVGLLFPPHKFSENFPMLWELLKEHKQKAGILSSFLLHR